MPKFAAVYWLLLLSFATPAFSQHLYYKTLDATVVKDFKDSAGKILIFRKDTLLRQQFAYVMRFYPQMQVDAIIVEFKRSKHVANTRPTFFSLFMAPYKRTYKVTLSEETGSTIDSVIYHNLSFNGQIGMIANQVSMIDELSAGGFFTVMEFMFKRMSAKGKNKVYRKAEEKTIDVGLGHQLLSYNTDFIEKLRIEKWQSTIGYENYVRYYRKRPMRTELIQTFVNDLPVYITNQYR